MVAAEYLGRSRLFRRLKRGAHGQLVELYAARLIKDGLARQGTWRCLSLVGDLLSWIARRRSTVADLDERMVERYLRGRARKQSIQPGDRAALKRLLSVLRDAGMIAPAAVPPVTPQDRIFEAFSDYLRSDLGLVPKSTAMWSVSNRTGTSFSKSAVTSTPSAAARRRSRARSWCRPTSPRAALRYLHTFSAPKRPHS